MSGKMRPLPERLLRPFEERILSALRDEVFRRDVYRLLGRCEEMQSGCIEFRGSHNGRRYGLIYSSRLKKGVYAHRLMCDAVHGLGNLYALHSCDNPPCVNPDHLRPGTPTENYADAIKRGRNVLPPRIDWPAVMRRRKHHWQLLDATDIPVIRRRLAVGDRVCDIARSFGVAGNTIGNIKAGTRWRHIA